MSYKLYTDKQETFECKIHLEGASLTKATSRILVETLDLNSLHFKKQVPHFVAFVNPVASRTSA